MRRPSPARPRASALLARARARGGNGGAVGRARRTTETGIRPCRYYEREAAAGSVVLATATRRFSPGADAGVARSRRSRPGHSDRTTLDSGLQSGVDRVRRRPPPRATASATRRGPDTTLTWPRSQSSGRCRGRAAATVSLPTCRPRKRRFRLRAPRAPTRGPTA